MNWPATFGCFCFCFCLARTKLDNYHCVCTHCVGLTLLNCYPAFLLRKNALEQARQPYLFCARNTRCDCSCHDWCFNFIRERPALEVRRRNLWCLSGPAESLSHWYRPSARGSAYDWQNALSIIFVYFGRVRISPKRGLVQSLYMKISFLYKFWFIYMWIKIFFICDRLCTWPRLETEAKSPEYCITLIFIAIGKILVREITKNVKLRYRFCKFEYFNFLPRC